MACSKEVWLGALLIVLIPILIVVFYHFRVITSLYTVIEGILVAVLSAMLLGGVALIYHGRRPSEEEILRRKSVYDTIKEWVEPSIQMNVTEGYYPLAHDPPKLASEIRNCLSRNYPSIWKDLQVFRSKYAEWTTSEVPKDLIETVEGVSTVNLSRVEARKKSLRDEVVRMHSSLVQQFRSEIIDKHYTRLKC